MHMRGRLRLSSSTAASISSSDSKFCLSHLFLSIFHLHFFVESFAVIRLNSMSCNSEAQVKLMWQLSCASQETRRLMQYVLEKMPLLCHVLNGIMIISVDYFERDPLTRFTVFNYRPDCTRRMVLSEVVPDLIRTRTLLNVEINGSA